MNDGSNDDGPRPLDYRRPVAGSDRPATPAVVQFLAGVGLWILVLAAAVGVLRAAGGRSSDVLIPVVAVTLGGSIALGKVVRWRYNWRGFLPGVLVGVGLTCLVPVGIVVVLCGPWRR